VVCYMLCGADRLWLPGRTVGFVGAFAIGGRLGEAFLVRISDSSMSAVTQTDPPRVEMEGFKLTHPERGKKLQSFRIFRKMCGFYGQQTYGARRRSN